MHMNSKSQKSRIKLISRIFTVTAIHAHKWKIIFFQVINILHGRRKGDPIGP